MQTSKTAPLSNLRRSIAFNRGGLGANPNSLALTIEVLLRAGDLCANTLWRLRMLPWRRSCGGLPRTFK